ncbi:hypothetical protein [Lactococcus lactis]|uniref:hypothetical protein n=1 Tax=Lactococcus lactis TaxID=1358 RepID=UPI00223B1113|nr:hypothetical protein [Lactococcus lactis]
MFPKTKKAFIIFGLITILIISYPYMLAGITWAWGVLIVVLLAPLWFPLSYLFFYSPKTLICYDSTPPEDKQKEIKSNLGLSEKKLRKTSFDFYNNVLNGQYDALLDTKEYFLIYKNYQKSLTPEPTIILVINKKENTEKLGNIEKDFLNSMIPRCKIYVKKR